MPNRVAWWARVLARRLADPERWRQSSSDRIRDRRADHGVPVGSRLGWVEAWTTDNLEGCTRRNACEAREVCLRRIIRPVSESLFNDLQPDIVERFRAHVDRSAGPDACHPWMGATFRGYGYFTISSTPKRTILAHRMALMLKLGRDLPVNEVTRHSNQCTTKACCNEEHLSEGTHADNVHDRDAGGRTARGSRHGKSRLTEAQAAEAKRRAAAGEPHASVARSFGVSATCIWSIATNRTWVHV